MIKYLKKNTVYLLSRPMAILFLIALISLSCSKNSPTDNSTPAAPSELTGLATGAYSVNLQWQDNSDNETGFIIYRSINNPFEEVGRTSADDINFDDELHISCVEVSYYVSAAGRNVESSYSNRITVQMLCTP